MKKLILFFTALICFQATSASHIAVAEIWYEHDTLNDYKVHLRLFRDCGGVGLPQSQPIKLSSVLQSVTTTHSLGLAANYYQSYCMTTSCQNPSSAIPGYQINEYSGIVTVPSISSDWVFSWTSCCRNASANLSGTAATYVEASLNNANGFFSAINNAPVSPYAVPLFHPIGVATSLSFAGIEIDGDSLDYKLVAPRVNATSPATFISPNTVTNPFPNTSLSLDPQTGLMNFNATTVGTYFFAVEVSEYRNGVLMSKSIRDYQFVLVSGMPANNTPSLSGINGTNVFVRNINICGPANMNFTINSSDLDVNDSTDISVIAQPTTSTFTTTATQNQVGSFSWSPTLSDVRSQPYLLVLKVKDNNCGVSHQIYQLFVNNCNTDSVWAGDANADFTCNNTDVLSIGLANGSTGPVRIGATINWQAEWCANWATNFNSNINYKHADCNGDGTVNSSDLAAVTANYGMVHTKTGQIGQYKTLGLPDLYCDVSSIQAHKGSTVSVPIMLGSTNSLMNDFYGISASVELLNAQTSAPISVTKNVSWIGNSTNSFAFDKNLFASKSAFTFVRNDQQNVTAQHGQIGEINFPIDNASAVGSKVIVQFSDIKMINSNGEEIQDYNVLSDTITILSPNTVNDIDKGFSIDVYPNPTSSKMTIALKIDKTQHYSVTLYDVVGKAIGNEIFSGFLEIGDYNLDLDLSEKATGQYLLKVQSEIGKTVLPIQKR